MRKFMALTLKVTALAISVLFAGQQILFAQTPAATTNPALAERSARVDQLIAPLVREGVPGVEVMVIQNGQVVKNKGYGLADVENRTPITAQTVFDLASVSKQFTAMGVMILMERGRLSLDDALTRFFPEFPAYAQKITIRHLLTHTSGLVDAINPRLFRSGYQPTSRDLLKLMMRERNVNFAPGEKFEYNNSGYVLLALIVEKVSGQRFSKFMNENVFKPLGMTHTLVYDETKPKVANLAVSYSNQSGAFKPTGYLSDIYFYGPKGVLTTAEDLYKWDQAIETGRLVKPTTLAQLFAPAKLNNGTTVPYGFGWYIAPDNGLAVVEHAGGYLGYRTAIRRYTERHTTVIVLSNNATIEAGPLARRIGQIYVGEQAAQAAASVKVDVSVLESYVGKYEGDPAVMANLIIEITLENGELYITSPIKPKTKLIAQSQTEFQIAETASSVTFSADAQGNVTGLLLKTRRATINARRLR